VKTALQGLHELVAADYHALNAINKTGLDYIAKSPAHYQAYLKEPQEPTDAMIIGTATHYGVFEPELLYKNFFARPEGIDGRTKDGKARLEELGRQNAGKTMIKADEMAMIEGMMKSVRGHKLASQLISGGKAEMSAIAQDQEYGVLCKARPDYIRSDDTIIDLKTTDDASFFAFQRKVKGFRYHVQAAWYLDTVNAAIGREQFKQFVLLVVEKSAPFGLIVYELDADAIKIGRIEARQNLKVYAECLKKNEWPGYSEHIYTMTVPVYE
jgi:hypothetical protein